MKYSSVFHGCSIVCPLDFVCLFCDIAFLLVRTKGMKYSSVF